VGELSGKPYGTSNSNTFLALKHGHGGFLFFFENAGALFLGWLCMVDLPSASW
jgi:hypothetical protein